MMRKRTATAAALVAAAALTLAACGGGSDDGKKTSGSGDDNGAVLPNTAWAKASYDDVKEGGTLTQAVGQLPYNFNINQVDDGLGDTATIEGPVLGTATKFNADGTYTFDPDYATSVKLVSENPEKVEVKLNPKGVWSDGAPIVADDMISTWKALNGADEKYQIISDNGFKDIGSVEQGATPYDYTVTFKTVNADWANYIYPAFPKSVGDSPDAFNKGFVDKMFPSNGPYVISKIDANAQVITETRNPKWWGRKPKLDTIVFRVIDQDALGQAFANKEINVLDTGANQDVLAQAQKRTDAAIQKSGGLTWTHLTFNAAKAPLDDVHVRKAVAYAIDREAMASVIQKPLGVKPSTQGSVIYVPGQKGYEDVASKEIGYSLKKSAAELKEAGYTKGSDGMYAKDGKPLAFSITVPSDTPTNAQRAQLIQGFLKKAGIALKLETVTSAKYFSDYILKGNYDSTSFSWQGTPFPVSTTQSLFDPADAGQNYTGITDPRLADLWAKANAELDPDKQIALATDIDKVVYDYVPIVTIAPTPTIFAVEKGIVNIGAAQFESPDYTAVGFKK